MVDCLIAPMQETYFNNCPYSWVLWEPSAAGVEFKFLFSYLSIVALTINGIWRGGGFREKYRQVYVCELLVMLIKFR